jgi:hypothetical protein
MTQQEEPSRDEPRQIQDPGQEPDGPEGGESTPKAPSNPTPSGGTNPGSDDQGTNEEGSGVDVGGGRE